MSPVTYILIHKLIHYSFSFEEKPGLKMKLIIKNQIKIVALNFNTYIDFYLQMYIY